MLICKAKHLLYQSIYLLQKMGESTSKFDFERIVPVFLREPSRSVFCANRPGRIVPGRNWFLRETSRNPRKFMFHIVHVHFLILCLSFYVDNQVNFQICCKPFCEKSGRQYCCVTSASFAGGET